ncbi:MAG: NFACT family protein [Candidatus Brocadiae bacterium]|nr:NFACT family protein [Candidatus Brocadiia bacterium]
MSLSYAELASAMDDVRPLLVGGRLQQITQLTPTSVVLALYAGGERRHLLIATEPRFARIHLIADKPHSSGDLSHFTRTARQNLRGRQLLALDLHPGDRVVELSFGRPADPAGRLVAELTGRTSNLFHVGPTGELVAVLRSARKSDRDLHPGAPYTPPPPLPAPPARSAQNRFADATGSISAAMDALYSQQEARARVGTLRDGLTSRLNAERKRTHRLLVNLEKDVAQAGDAEHLRLCGELLKLHLHEVPPRATAIAVPNLYASGSPELDIPLKPALSGRQNMEHYFKRYKKLLTAQERGTRRLAEVRQKLDDLDAALLRVQEAATPDQLEALTDELARPARSKRQPSRRAGPNRFTSADGLEILVGRTPAENDEVTFRLSRGNDMWLHVEGYTGSHVVVRVPKGKTVPKETLLDAAALAVQYSKLRDAGAGPVAYCACKNVSKAKRAKPGQVLYTQSKTLHITVERPRIDRLLQRES